MISFIIPTLNEEKLLPQLLAQMFVDEAALNPFEVVVSDGGSTDATVEQAAQFPVRIVHADPSTLQTIALGRNLGAASAAGDVFAFINADVRFKDFPGFLAKVEETFSRQVCAGATCLVHVFPEEERWNDRAFHVVHNLYVRFLNAIGEGMGRGECQILTREMFARVGGYNGAMVAGEDYDLFRRVRKHGPIVFLPDTVLYESPRRFRKYGYSRIIWGWTKNALSVVFRNASSSDTWEPVR